MKKLLVLLLLSALAFFVFAGCEGFTPPNESEGEGEGDMVNDIKVEIDGAKEIGGLLYTSPGNHDIILTFSAPVQGNVSAYITPCFEFNGINNEKIPAMYSGDIVLFPNEDRTVWEGSAFFGYNYLIAADGRDYPKIPFPCCASYITVETGECETENCKKFPVIVDGADPYLKFKITIDDTYQACPCGGYVLKLTSQVVELACNPDVECCGDSCSGLAGWSFSIFDEYPWNVCCDTGCEEPIFDASGTGCPIEFTTDCLDENKIYYANFIIADNVGNESKIGFPIALIENDNDNLNGSMEEEFQLPDNCEYDNNSLRICEAGEEEIIMILDPDWSMEEDCNLNCGF